MVDLVKIRKKKAKKAEENAAAQENAPVQESGAEAPAEQPAAAQAVAAQPVPRGSSGSSVETAPAATTPAPPRNPEEPRGTANPNPNAEDKLARFKAEAGKRREEHSIEAEAIENVGAQLELLTYVISGEHYAVDIERIVEIVTPRPVTRIPNADPSIVGIISLRGTIVTIVDVRRRLHHPPAGEAGVDTRIVVVDYHNETVGFVVDRVLRVVKTAAREVEPPPVVHASELDESVRGVFRAAGALTILLDLDKLLDSRALAATVA